MEYITGGVFWPSQAKQHPDTRAGACQRAAGAAQ